MHRRRRQNSASRSTRNLHQLERLEERLQLSAALMGAATAMPPSATRYRIDSFDGPDGGAVYGTTYLNGTMQNAQLFFNRYKKTFTPYQPSPTPPAPPPAPDPDPAPPQNSQPVTITQTQEGSFMRLTITGTSDADSIVVSQSGDTITINGNGNITTESGSFAEIAIYGQAGDDSITVQSSVNISTLLYGGSGNNTLVAAGSAKSFIVTIGAGTDSLTGNGINTSFWADTTDAIHASAAEIANGGVHRVSAFYQPFSTDPNNARYIPLTLAGQNLPDPTDAGSETRLNNSLWGAGPSMTDINQGGVGDCYYLASLQSLAFSQPERLEEMAVDLGDGTYAVEFMRNNTPTFVRVDGDLPAGYWQGGLAYAHPLTGGGAIWAPIMEKAYAFFRTGASTYDSINSGWTGSALADLGVASNTVSSNAQGVFNTIKQALANDKPIAAVTNGSVSNSIPIIGSHAYSVVGTSVVNGVQYVQVRNPWGDDGAGNDGNPNDGLVTITLAQFQSAFSALSIVI